MDWNDMEDEEYDEYEDRSSEDESEEEDIRCNEENTWVTEAINQRIFLTQEGKDKWRKLGNLLYHKEMKKLKSDNPTADDPAIVAADEAKQISAEK